MSSSWHLFEKRRLAAAILWIMISLSCLPIAMIHCRSSSSSGSSSGGAPSHSSSSSSSSQAIWILRIRGTDGSIHRVSVPTTQINTLTLDQVLTCNLLDPTSLSKEDGTDQILMCYRQQQQQQQQKQPLDRYQTLAQLNLHHGDLIQLVMKPQASSLSSSKTSLSSSAAAAAAATTTTINSNQSINQKGIDNESSSFFDPFPHLSKRHQKTNTFRTTTTTTAASASSSSKYKSLQQLQDIQRQTMHSLSTSTLSKQQEELNQKNYKISSVYMCGNVAQRFQQSFYNKTLKKKQVNTRRSSNRNSIIPPYALLFGSIESTDSKNKNKNKKNPTLSTTKTSSSSSSVYIHALWIPPPSMHEFIVRNIWNPEYFNNNNDKINENEKEETSSSSSSRNTKLDKCQKEYQRILHIASKLGLQLVGWIYAYDNDDENSLSSSTSKDHSNIPTTTSLSALQGQHYLQYAALGQIHTMKQQQQKHDNNDDSEKQEICFITLAMDRHTGSTEAFQVQDICIQMFAEGIFHDETSTSSNDNNNNNDKKNKRILTTKESILIDGKETNEIDSILCWMNTAILPHVGTYTNPEKVDFKSIIKMDGDDDEYDIRLFQSLCDFQILLTLDRYLSKQENQELYRLIQQFVAWDKTKKKKTKDNRPPLLSTRLKLMLENIISDIDFK